MSRGFTLVEVLLATLLLGLVMLASFSLYDGTSRLKEQAEASGDMTLQAQFAFRSIETDLRAAWISTIDDELRQSTINRMNAGIVSTATADSSDEKANEGLAFVGESGEHELGPDDYLELITAAGKPLGETKGDLVRARYFVLRDDENPHRSSLIRTGHPFMAPRLGGTDRAPAEEEYRVVARGVVGFDCAYRRSTEWVRDWDSQTTGTWPLAVDVALTMQSSRGHTQTFRTKIYLRVPAEYAEPEKEE